MTFMTLKLNVKRLTCVFETIVPSPQYWIRNVSSLIFPPSLSITLFKTNSIFLRLLTYEPYKLLDTGKSLFIRLFIIFKLLTHGNLQMGFTKVGVCLFTHISQISSTLYNISFFFFCAFLSDLDSLLVKIIITLFCN